MALTVTPVKKTAIGAFALTVSTVAFDSSYPDGGEALTPADLGLKGVIAVIAEPSAGYVLEYDHTNEKLIAYWGDYDAGADGVFIQPDGEDLTGITAARIVAIGHS